jgi:hypothetical protein
MRTAIARALAEGVCRYGADTVFGLPGGGPNLDVVGAAEDAGLRFVLAHGETASCIMAGTYGSRFTRRHDRGRGVIGVGERLGSPAFDRRSYRSGHLCRADGRGPWLGGSAWSHRDESVFYDSDRCVDRHTRSGGMTDMKIAKFRDVSTGVQAGQFAVGDRNELTSFDDLDPSFKKLMDDPVTQVLGIVGPGGRANLTPMWFDYEGVNILLNCAEHRMKTGWIRKNGQLTSMLMNPVNPYHWMSIKHTVVQEISEDDPVHGPRVTAQLDRIWTKYTQQPAPYGLRDPSINERRVLFVCRVDQIATFGQA